MTYHYRLDRLTGKGEAWEPVKDLSGNLIFLTLWNDRGATFLNTYMQQGFRWHLCQKGG